MQDDSSQDWQKPAETASGAPFQAAVSEAELNTSAESIQPASVDAEVTDSTTPTGLNSAENDTPAFGDDATPAVESDDSEILVRWQGPEHLYSERS